MRAALGPARAHSCVRHQESGTGRQAQEWAQVHGTDGEDPWADYLPLCKSCHRFYDMTPEARANIAAGKLTQYESAEAREKTGAVNRGCIRSQATRDKISEASVRRWALPGERERAKAAAQRREAGEPALIRSRGETARQARM